VVFADQAAVMDENFEQDTTLRLDSGGGFISPAVFTIPLQLLAYHVAVLRGTDVDQPRNLAKSVTVE
jgi:glucosamine--fructose-6-phosphate aminotransferase (isomerizing)